MNINNCEIERKFLIRMPDAAFLEKNASYTDIEQTYLLPSEKGFSERVRKRGRDGSFIYYHTRKKHITDIRRVELESEISESEYKELLKRADPERRAIQKRRWCLEYRGQMFEIDIYSFWNDRATMELELENEEQGIEFPEDIDIVRELTHDKRYTNASLAKHIPEEDISLPGKPIIP